MSRSRKMTMTITALLLAIWTVPCHAAESALKGIFLDSVYGGLTGSLLGAAALVFTKKPADHLEFIGYGAAAGVAAGAIFGIGKALVEIDNGKVRYSMPTIIPDFQEANSRSKMPIVVTAELLRGKF